MADNPRRSAAMTAEADVQAAIALRLGSRPDVRLFRNNTGTAWQGVNVTPPHLKPGHIILKTPRCIRFGLHNGSPDLVGWHSITITKDMVGRRVALFVGLEVKTQNGRAASEQQRFLDAMAKAGACGGVFRNEAEAEAHLLKNY